LFWVFVCGCVAIPIATGLALWSWLNGRRAGLPSKQRAVAAGCLLFVLIPVGLLWFFSYALYSGAVRKVDPGLGDLWAVPLPHGYFFCMIDVTTSGYLMKDGCSGSPPLRDIGELAQVGDAIVGVSGITGAFVFDTASSKVTLYESPAVALAQFSPAPSLQPADDFYRRHRFAWQDVAAALILFSLVLGISWIWFRRFVCAPAMAAVDVP